MRYSKNKKYQIYCYLKVEPSIDVLIEVKLKIPEKKEAVWKHKNLIAQRIMGKSKSSNMGTLMHMIPENLTVGIIHAVLLYQKVWEKAQWFHRFHPIKWSAQKLDMWLKSNGGFCISSEIKVRLFAC